MALGNLYRLAHSTSPHASLASLSASTLSTPSEIVARTSDSSIVEATLPPSSQHRTQLPSSLDKTQLERLADEVDSLVREIIEAVPAFSYSLSQGSYGPLPMRVKNQHSTAADITIQQYLEQVHILHPQYPTTHGLLAPHREHVASTSINPQVIPDLEQEGIDMSTWWPNRLRLDLRDGLLMDDVEDSPQISLGSSVLPTMPYRQEASGAESQIGPTTASHSRNGSSISIGQGEDAGRGRNDQLLAEGRRRWTEYLQGRQ